MQNLIFKVSMGQGPLETGSDMPTERLFSAQSNADLFHQLANWAATDRDLENAEYIQIEFLGVPVSALGIR